MVHTEDAAEDMKSGGRAAPKSPTERGHRSCWIPTKTHYAIAWYALLPSLAKNRQTHLPVSRRAWLDAQRNLWPP